MKIESRKTRPYFIAVLIFLLPYACVQAQLVKPREVRDLHYGMVLFEFYQQNYYTAAVNLLVAQEQNRLQNSDDEARLLLGGLYLSYGLHAEAEEIFQILINEGTTPEVRDRAWFFIGKIRYHKQLFDEAQIALDRVGDALDKALQEEFLTLRSNLLMAQKNYPEAVNFLDAMSKKGDDDLSDANYVRYNLGVALISAGKQQEGMKLIKKVGELKSNDPSIKALRDKANLALGYSLLKTDPVQAKNFLQRVRLKGPFSNRALLGLGWAEIELQRFEQALVPWQELASRKRTDVAVFESLLAVGNALERLRAFPQAMLSYQNAITMYEQELAALESTVAAVKAGRLWADLLAQVSRNEMGWFWEAELLPETPEANYLPTLMAGHEFHEAIKNLRDLKFLEDKLNRWEDEMPAFDNMLQLRQKTYESQLNKLTPEQTLNHVVDDRTSRDIYAEELKRVEASGDAFALATAEERKHIERLASVEERIWRLSNIPDFGQAKAEEYRERQKLIKGVLEYDIQTTFAIRHWQVRKSLNSLDRELESTLAQQESLQTARQGAPQRFEGYNRQITVHRARIASLQAEVRKAFEQQQHLLQSMVDIELDQLRLRLVDYLDQARFSLAHLQDLATDAGEATIVKDYLK